MSKDRQAGRLRSLFRSAWLRTKFWDAQLSDGSFAAMPDEYEKFIPDTFLFCHEPFDQTQDRFHELT